MSTNSEKVKEALKIEDVIGSYIQLTPSGSSFRARCPFHSEKSPSFYVTPSKEMYYCFGCGKGGDIFTFVQEIEGIQFKEALELLADRAGIKLEKESGYDDRSTKGDVDKSRLYSLARDTIRIFEFVLRKTPEAIAYLKERGLSSETITKFKIGYAPIEKNYLTKFLLKQGYSRKEILASGFAFEYNGTLIDRFRERIIFPLFDPTGKAVGVSARIFPLPGSTTDISKIGKYINSPEGPIYDKSRVLYGYNLAKLEMKRAGRAVLVEGQMDLIMSHQAGITEAVALSGTALSPYHLDLIKRFTDTLVIMLDSDNAGIKATMTIAEKVLTAGMMVLVAELPDGKDPADLIKDDPSIVESAITDARSPIVYRLNILKQSNEYSLPKVTQILHSELYPLLSQSPLPLYVDKMIDEIAFQIGRSHEAVSRDYRTWYSKQQFETSLSKPAISSTHTRELDTFDILYGIYRHVLKESEHKDLIELVHQELLPELIPRLRDHGNLSDIDDMKLKIYSEEHYGSRVEKMKVIISELINQINKESLRRERETRMAQLSNNPSDTQSLLRELDIINKKIDHLND